MPDIYWTTNKDIFHTAQSPAAMRLPVAAGPPVFPEGRSLILPLNSFVQFTDQSKGLYHRKKKKNPR